MGSSLLMVALADDYLAAGEHVIKIKFLHFQLPSLQNRLA